MGFYADRVFPWVTEKMLGTRAVQRVRAEALADARGQVIEIGFGSGANLPFYPAEVERVVAVEPNAGMRRRARRQAGAGPSVEIVTGVAERLPFEDATFDTAVSTFTLCSVDDPDVVLRELLRVLKPGGRLLFCEHGLADAPGVARWQHRLDPIQQVIGCGCHLDRPMRRLVEHSGARIEQLREGWLAKAPRTHGWITVGSAVRT